MNYYDSSGSPYSDEELYHFGIEGMHWYQRRFQNPDGTLTAAGKARYAAARAAKATGRAVGKAAVATGKAVGKGTVATAKFTGRVIKRPVDKFVGKRTWLMSEKDLEKRIARLEMEKKYRDLIKSTTTVNRGRKMVADILEQGGKTIASGAFNKLSNKMFNKADKNNPLEQIRRQVYEQFNDMSDDELREYAGRAESLNKIYGGKGKK